MKNLLRCTLLLFLTACSETSFHHADESHQRALGGPTEVLAEKSLCGNGIVDENEQCDGDNINFASCVSLINAPGQLFCNADCTFDTTQCLDLVSAPSSAGSGKSLPESTNDIHCGRDDRMVSLMRKCHALQFVDEKLVDIMRRDICDFPPNQIFSNNVVDETINNFRAFYLDVLYPDLGQLQNGERRDLFGEYEYYSLDEQKFFACVFDELRENLTSVKLSQLSAQEHVDFQAAKDYLAIFSNLIKTDVGLAQIYVDSFSGVSRYAPWLQMDGLGLWAPPFAPRSNLPALMIESEQDAISWSNFLKSYLSSIERALDEMRKGIDLGYKGHLAQIDPAAALGPEFDSFWNPDDVFGFFWIDGPQGKLEPNLPAEDFLYGGPLAYLGERENEALDNLVENGVLTATKAAQYKREHARIYDDILEKMLEVDDFIATDYRSNARTGDDDMGVWATIPNNPEQSEAQYEAIAARRIGIVPSHPVPCIKKIADTMWTPSEDPYIFFFDDNDDKTLVQKLNSCGLSFVEWFNEQKLYWQAQYEQEIGMNFASLDAVYAHLDEEFAPVEGVHYLCEEHFDKTSAGNPAVCEPDLDEPQFAFGSQNGPNPDQETLLYETLKSFYEANFARLGLPWSAELKSPLKDTFSEVVLRGVRSKIPKVEFFGGTGPVAAFAFDVETGGLKVLFQTADPKAPRLVNMLAVQVHELYMGHGFQLPLDLATLELNFEKFSFVRDIFIATFGENGAFTSAISNGANAEGWASYSEILGGEIGLYNKIVNDEFSTVPDPASFLFALSEASRLAARLVVDTGLNSRTGEMVFKTFDEALTWFKENTQLPDNSVREFVNRVIAVPAQSLTYGTGAMAILALRMKAKDDLGASFDIRDFHDAVLLDASNTTVNALVVAVNNYLSAHKN